MHWFYYDNLLPSNLFNIKTKTFSKQTHEADQPDYALIMYWFYYNNLLPSNFFNSKTTPILNSLMKLTNLRKLGESTDRGP